MKNKTNFFLLVALVIAATCCFIYLAPGAVVTVSAASGGSSGILMDEDSGAVLDGYRIHEKLPMASTTKVLTAITVIESMDISKEVSVPACAVGVEGSSIYLTAGEKLTVKQLLYGLMLQSGNDCAVALATVCAGNVEKFADKMNEKAQAIGAKESHFVNPHGLHHDEHYTTAYDLALITSYAMKNKEFREIVSTKKVKIPFGGRNYDRVLLNKNKMLAEFPGATGVKTGFTKRAGRCLVSAAERDGVRLVCVVLNCPDMWEKSKAFLESGFAKFVHQPVCERGQVVGEIPVYNAAEGATVKLCLQEGFAFNLEKGTENELKVKADFPERLLAPVKKGEIIGNFSVTYRNQLIFSIKIITMDSVKENNYNFFLKKVLEMFFT